MNDSREIESWRTLSVSPSPPKMTSWWATKPCSRTEWIGSCTLPPAPRISSAVRLAVPDGASFFWSWCNSMISTSGMCWAICFETSIIITAPIAKFGATKRFAEPTPSSCEKSAPVVPITQCTPASRHSVALCRALSGVVKSTTTSASPSTSCSDTPRCRSARPTSAMSSAPSTAAQTVCPILPAAPETATLIRMVDPPSAWPWGRGLPILGGDELRVHSFQRGLEDVLVATDGRRRQARRVVEPLDQRGDVVCRNGVRPRQHLVERQQRNARKHRRAKPVHARQHRLHRQDGAALHVLLRPLELVRAHVLVTELAQLAADDLHRLRDVVRARADVHADLTRVEILA